MAMDFPASPTVGQVYGGYVWTGTGWRLASSTDYIKKDLSNFGFFWDQNLIDNADFIVAQRGAQHTIGTSGIVDGLVTTDRWHINGNTGVRMTNSGSFGQMTLERASGSGSAGMYQHIETSRWLNPYWFGKTSKFLVQVDVQSVSSPGDLTITLYTTSAEGSVTGATVRGSLVTTAASATAARPVVFLVTLPASGFTGNEGMYLYFQANLGSTSQKWIFRSVVMRPVRDDDMTPVFWLPRPYAIDLMMCQRFYETGRSSILQNASGASQYAGDRVFFKVTKRAVPTIAITTVNSNGISGRTTDLITNHGFRIQGTSTAATGLVEANDDWTASAEI